MISPLMVMLAVLLRNCVCHESMAVQVTLKNKKQELYGAHTLCTALQLHAARELLIFL